MVVPGRSDFPGKLPYRGMTIEKTHDDVPTLIAVGALVAICASLAHEALGHGVGCVADGGRVTLITFLVFRCDGAGVLADGGGPAGAFLVACVCLIVLYRSRPEPTLARLFTYALGVQLSFWVGAQMVREGFDGSDDWGHVAHDLGWAAGWHAGVIAVGIIGYGATVRIAAKLGEPLAQGQPARLLIPYASTCMFAVAFGAMWHGGRAVSALDGFLSFGIASLGYLLAIRVASRKACQDRIIISRNWLWLTAVTFIGCIFALTIARGVGQLR